MSTNNLHEIKLGDYKRIGTKMLVRHESGSGYSKAL